MIGYWLETNITIFLKNKYVGIKETFVRVETLWWDWSEFMW